MKHEILVPDLPESVSDATLVAWHKQPGDPVSKDETLVELETDKVVLDVPAPADGVLKEILKTDGETVTAGELLAIMEEQKLTEPETISSETAADDIPLSPAVRRLIQENQLDPHKILGSGKHGRILKSDVLAYLEKQAEQQQSKVADTPPKTETTDIETPVYSHSSPIRPEQRVPMTRLRAKIAERLLQAQQNAAMLTTFNEVNMQSVINLRQQYKERFEQKHQVKLGFMSFFVKASIEALKRFPGINASIDGNDIIYHGYYDIGIAVSSPRGLIVPVIRDADQLDFAGIEKSIAEFGGKAKEGTISVEDLTGGTFTITNGGIFGSMLSTPILNPPQCAILGMHAIKERAVVENGEIVIRPIMYLALSYDHRLVDGKEAVQFLGTIKECLEAPAHLLLNI
jgi:2-oxoglutarate dehydrogenase E2 component (dihydrolipoamide succinyltransferase)